MSRNADFDVPESAVELEHRRASWSKHYRLDDGQIRIIFQNDIHYYDGVSWGDTVFDFVDDGSDAVSDKSPVKCRFTSSELQLESRVSGVGMKIKYKAKKSKTTKKVKIYNDGTDWEFSKRRRGVRFEAEIQNKVGAKTHVFKYSITGSDMLEERPDGGLSGKHISLRPPTVVCADGSRYRCRWRVVGARIEFDFDDTDLPAEAFPYVIDPTIDFDVGASGDDKGVYASDTSWPADATVIAGDFGTIKNKYASSTYYIDVGYVRWDTSSLPDSGEVTSVSLYLFCNTKNSEYGSPAIGADAKNSSDWPIGSEDYPTALDGILGTQALSWWSAGNWSSIAGNAYMKSHVSKTGYTGFQLSISPAGSSSGNSLTTDEYGETNPPYLSVTYAITGSAGLTGTSSIAAGGYAVRTESAELDGDSSLAAQHSSFKTSGAVLPTSNFFDTDYSSFESGSLPAGIGQIGFTLTVTSSEAYDGVYSLKAESDWGAFWWPGQACIEGREYEVSIVIKMVTKSLQLGIDWYDAGLNYLGSSLSTPSSSTSWTKSTLIATAPANATILVVTCGTGTVDTEGYVDLASANFSYISKLEAVGDGSYHEAAYPTGDSSLSASARQIHMPKISLLGEATISCDGRRIRTTSASIEAVAAFVGAGDIYTEGSYDGEFMVVPGGSYAS